MTGDGAAVGSAGQVGAGLPVGASPRHVARAENRRCLLQGQQRCCAAEDRNLPHRVRDVTGALAGTARRYPLPFAIRVLMLMVTMMMTMMMAMVMALLLLPLRWCQSQFGTKNTAAGRPARGWIGGFHTRRNGDDGNGQTCSQLTWARGVLGVCSSSRTRLGGGCYELGAVQQSWDLSGKSASTAGEGGSHTAWTRGCLVESVRAE